MKKHVHIHLHARGADSAGWEEAKHPRRGDGKFGAGSGPITVKFGGKSYEVASVEEAQAKWSEFRQRMLSEGMGASETGNGIELRQGGRVIGRVSYNGRFHPTPVPAIGTDQGGTK